MTIDMMRQELERTIRGRDQMVALGQSQMAAQLTNRAHDIEYQIRQERDRIEREWRNTDVTIA